MNILLIGGTGFMGSALVDHLLRIGVDNVVTVSRSDKHLVPGNHRHYNVSAIGWDAIISELDDYNKWTVIDLAYASVPNTSFTDPVKDFSDNLYLVNKHLEKITKLDVAQYIYISSGGTVYGDVKATPITEDAQNFPLSPYGITKLACERYVNLHRYTHGLKACIVRPSNIFGPGQKPFRGQGLIATALGLAYKNEAISIFGDGSHKRDFLYVDDFCSGIGNIIHKGEDGGIYNLGSGAGLSLNDVIDAIDDILQQSGIAIKKNYFPERPFDVKNNVLDSSRLTALTGWTPKVGFKDGLLKTQQWIKLYLAEKC